MLQLFPNLLGEHRHHQPFLPASIDKAVKEIDGLIAESERAGRRFLGRFDLGGRKAEQIPIAVLRPDSDLDFLVEPMINGERWGFVADAGLPCVADPGALLVQHARKCGVKVQAFVGPSSVTLALMLSGLPSQRFSFHGYLDKHPDERKRRVKYLEELSRKDDATQVFIEAPYRNKHLLDTLVNELDDKTMLCVAWDLTMPGQGVLSQPVGTWEKSPLPNLDKKPAVFLVKANAF